MESGNRRNPFAESGNPTSFKNFILNFARGLKKRGQTGDKNKKGTFFLLLSTLYSLPPTPYRQLPASRPDLVAPTAAHDRIDVFREQGFLEKIERGPGRRLEFGAKIVEGDQIDVDVEPLAEALQVLEVGAAVVDPLKHHVFKGHAPAGAL